MIYTEITYPDGLPCAIRDGYDLSHVQPFIRTEMDSGRARQRRRFSSVPTMANVSWIFPGDAYCAAFEAWFRDALHDGAEWFNMPIKTPIGEQEYVCRFTRMYQGPTLVGKGMWRITSVLEIFERPLMPPGWGLMPDYLINASLFDVAMNREWPEAP